MKKLLVLTCLLFSIYGNAQIKHFSEPELRKIADSIVAEANLLFRSESASWFGTDIFLEKFKGDRSNLGYFSYPDSILTKCVFFSPKPVPKVIGTITFDSTYAIDKGFLSMQERDFTDLENQYFIIRNKALDLIGTDSAFKFYNNTGTNIIPIINKGKKDVYVITGSHRQELVIFGNDYLIHFDKDNNITGRELLHQGIIPAEKNDTSTVGMIHTHLPGFNPFMTATDICTARLYERLTGWKNYTAVSKYYISIWNGHNLHLIYYRDKKDEDKK